MLLDVEQRGSSTQSGVGWREWLKGRDALAFLFANRQVWSERTPPMIQEESIRLAGPTAAFVDAQLVQYGSTIVKSGTPVVLLLEKEAGAWKIASWRMACPMVFAPPQ